MDVTACGNVLAGTADYLGIFAHRLAGGDVARCQLVAPRNDPACLCGLDRGSGFQRAGRSHDIVFRIESDGRGHLSLIHI